MPSRRTLMTEPSNSENTSELFLPDLCDIRAVFVVVVVAELLAIMLTLASDAQARPGFRELALVSLFVQWAALSSVVVLCLARGVLVRMGNVWAGVISYITVLVVTGVVTEVAYWAFVPSINANALEFWLYGLSGGTTASPEPETTIAPNHMDFLLASLGIAAIVAAVVLRYFFVQHQCSTA